MEANNRGRGTQLLVVFLAAGGEADRSLDLLCPVFLCAKAVDGRSTHEVRLHAHQYFLRLQAMSAQAGEALAHVGLPLLGGVGGEDEDEDPRWNYEVRADARAEGPCSVLSQAMPFFCHAFGHRQEDSTFEHAMAMFDEEDAQRFEKVATLLPMKTAADVRAR